MSSESKDISRRVDKEGGALVITNLIGAGVPDDVAHELLDEGIVGQLDWDLGASANPDDIEGDNPSAEGSLNRYSQFSRLGGYVVSHVRDDDRIIVGRASPSSMRFEELKGGKRDGKILKCVDLDMWGEIESGEFQGIREVVEERPRNVFHQIQDEQHAERIIAGLAELEREGRVNR